MRDALQRDRSQLGDGRGESSPWIKYERAEMGVRAACLLHSACRHLIGSPISQHPCDKSRIKQTDVNKRVLFRRRPTAWGGGGGGQAVNETVRQTRRPERSSSHYSMLSDVRARVCFGAALCKKKRPNLLLGCNLKPLILSRSSG